MSYFLDPFNWDITDPESIPNLLFAHLYITGVSLGIALAIAVPLSFLLARYRRLYLPIITTAGIIYTLPSLAVVAILVPVYRPECDHDHYSVDCLCAIGTDSQYRDGDHRG